MKHTDVLKLAFVLKILILIVFVCNLLALFLVPVFTFLPPGETLKWMVEGLQGLTGAKEMGEGYFPFLSMLAFSWAAVVMGAWTPVLTIFLMSCGVCTAIILWEAKRVLDTILREAPFCGENAGNLKRAAVCCFIISGLALVRLVLSLLLLRSIEPLFSYNALFVPIFFMGGLLCLVMSALFRQAEEIKEENDLTI